MLREMGSQKLIRTTDMMQQFANDINKMKRSLLRFYHCSHVALKPISGDRLQRESRSWLSPPDPSTNYNIACEIHQNGTATWFCKGNVFAKWKAEGFLLWLHGKREYRILVRRQPRLMSLAIAGSGKTILMYVTSHHLRLWILQ